jgi:hypothetical protein
MTVDAKLDRCLLPPPPDPINQIFILVDPRQHATERTNSNTNKQINYIIVVSVLKGTYIRQSIRSV